MELCALILAAALVVVIIALRRRKRGSVAEKTVARLRDRGFRAGVCEKCEGAGRLGRRKVCPGCHGLGYWHEVPDREMFKD